LLASLSAMPLLATGMTARADGAATHLVVINLRGGLDGLAAVPPYADPDYHKLRGGLALSGPGQGGIVDLDGSFGLHPALAPLRDFFRRGELLILPAAALKMAAPLHVAGQEMIAAQLAPAYVHSAGAPSSLHRDPAELDLIADL